mmetsp:Transcript_92483/g.288299  ORF Transcript_92483/g.288299 Transcript_92483/m.288299 type:complete len:120 (-) Transcript_92483:187-546(-)
MDGRDVVTVTLDAIKLKTDPGFAHLKGRMMPRCVGGDPALTAPLLQRLNRTFLSGRRTTDLVGCSRGEAVSAIVDDMAKPIAVRQGEVVVEGWDHHLGPGGGLDEPGAIPGDQLKPLVI